MSMENMPLSEASDLGTNADVQSIMSSGLGYSAVVSIDSTVASVTITLETP